MFIYYIFVNIEIFFVKCFNYFGIVNFIICLDFFFGWLVEIGKKYYIEFICICEWYGYSKYMNKYLFYRYIFWVYVIYNFIIYFEFSGFLINICIL